jgi:hypothetical protein
MAIDVFILLFFALCDFLVINTLVVFCFMFVCFAKL